ncbi:MAG TPA: pyridoxal kinase [Rhizomicrobium sp.]|nr:pyridoxal kinase [Rhizomicrobium sp.]
MNVLSIQSEVVCGHVGNAAARFALQRLGHEVWALPTVLLSSHAGYRTVMGETVTADLLRRLKEGLDTNGWLALCDAVLSGYLGRPEQAIVVADTVRRVKAARPAALYCLDPAFGDAGRAYAKPGVAEAMARHLLPLADIVTPNAFELGSIASIAIRGPQDALEASRRLGRPVVVTTSVPTKAGRIGTLAAAGDEAFLATTPLLENPPHGSGDLLAAIFLACRLQKLSLPDALAHATGSVFRILSRSEGTEMALIAEQDALLAPLLGVDLQIEAVR